MQMEIVFVAIYLVPNLLGNGWTAMNYNILKPLDGWLTTSKDIREW